MEAEKVGASGQTQQVDATHRVQEISSFFLALPWEDQRALLLAAASEIVPRLQNLSRETFLDNLRNMPYEGATQDADADHPESREEVFEDWLRQSLGAQRQILLLVAPRVMRRLQNDDREKYLLQMSQLILGADAGELNPTLH